MTDNLYGMMAILFFASILPYLIASGTCFLKFSIVFILIRNALGVQQVPSNMALNGIALFMALFVMLPIVQQGFEQYQAENVQLNSIDSIRAFADTGLGGYRAYLKKYSDPELVEFFEKAQAGRLGEKEEGKRESTESPSLVALLPAYALSEIQAAFKIGFYLYLPFVIVDMVISCILLALGMMMMSPVTISVPIKLILFVAMDGWGILSRGLVMQYIELAK
ncbi:MAG: type secretion system protein [Solimicrobium sp.]|jgi:type III secretion protein R|nr:type secretion system protein [Solimicrobium sp.]